MQVDRWKISAIIEWPKPNTIRGLRGTLGLTGYYWKFVLNCGTIAAPLMAILEKNSFHWTDDVITVFERLKSTMTTTPILILPKFELIFVIEWNASDIGIRAALLQQNNPVAYFNRTMAVRHQSLPTYEKELIGLVKTIKHWHSYFWGHKFLVRIDHYILKFLLEQRTLSSLS